MMYQFATQIDWPQKYKSGSFVLGVYGNPELYQELQENHARKMVGSQPIKIVRFNTLDEISLCHILYIDRSKSGSINRLVRKYKPSSTLIVSDATRGLQSGAIINFVVYSNQNRYELSKANAQAHSLTINSKISGYAVNVR